MQLSETTRNSSIEDFYISSKKLNYLNYFWLGFLIYTLSYVIKGNVHVNLRIGELFQFIGLIMLLTAGFLLIKFKIENNYLRFFFIIYCIWSLSVITRGIHFDYVNPKELLIDADSGVFLYFAPLIVLLPQDLTYFKKLFDAIVVLGIFYLVYDVLFIKPLLDRSFETQNVVEYLVRNLSMPCGYLLLTYKYHSNKRNFLAWIVMILSLLFSIYKARRGLSSILIGILISAYLLYLISTKRKVWVIYLSVLFLSIGALYGTSIYKIDNNKLLNFLVERGDVDTRSDVEDYFYDDMKKKDWIIGRGINGEYFCPDIEENQLTNYRNYIETGYLQIILKGGLIRLILFLLIAMPAVILGLFFSKNILSKASAIWIFIALISLYPATVESFSLQYLLVWISIGICFSKDIRHMSDYNIKGFLDNVNIHNRGQAIKKKN